MHYHFYRMRNSGLLDEIKWHARGWRKGRDAEPTAGIIGSQSVKIIEAGGPRGYDAGKKIKLVLSDCRRQSKEGAQTPHRD